MSQTKKTYEEAVARLEQIATLLEAGETPLEQSMKLYEESVQLSELCYKQISEYKAKIEILSKGEQND